MSGVGRVAHRLFYLGRAIPNCGQFSSEKEDLSDPKNCHFVGGMRP